MAPLTLPRLGSALLCLRLRVARRSQLPAAGSQAMGVIQPLKIFPTSAEH